MIFRVTLMMYMAAVNAVVTVRFVRWKYDESSATMPAIEELPPVSLRAALEARRALPDFCHQDILSMVSLVLGTQK